jgi:hypothetical protein
MLPVCVFFELRYGMLAGAFADLGGLLVIVALLAMWIGVIRYAGHLDAISASESEDQTPSDPTAATASGGVQQAHRTARRILVVGGIALALWGMAYGLWYAAFAEHQALDGIGASLTQAFTSAAQGQPAEAGLALEQYRETKYVYDRQVDVHSHWIGLAMLLVVLGLALEHVALSGAVQRLVALGSLIGAISFPLGVLLQTVNHGNGPRAIAILGSGLLVATLGTFAVGFARSRGRS